MRISIPTPGAKRHSNLTADSSSHEAEKSAVKPLTILHTSDWHLGRTLGKLKKRHEELKEFLDWLLSTIEREKVDVLLVAGDIFDTVAPANEAQGLYYSFLSKVQGSSCNNIVITSGNHDSQSFLNAPKELLKALSVHVVAEVTDNLEDELVSLTDLSGELILIVAAVPFLKDRVLRLATEGESIEERDRKMALGVKEHYEKLAILSEKLKGDKKVPIVAMGHLFARGGITHEGDGVRELYVGSLSRVDTASFPKLFDYVALGHLHSAQSANKNNIRYSGSPIHMSFNEAGENLKPKSVTLIKILNGELGIRELEIPVFQELITIKGDMKKIKNRLTELKNSGSSAWIEIIFDSDEAVGDLREIFDTHIKGSSLEILIIKNLRNYELALSNDDECKPLKEYTVMEVFDRVLDAQNVPENDREELKKTFNEVMFLFNEKRAGSQSD
ncbi:MAG: exonuclease SbcCD subunit D C-terminal domain-containing protein [Deltaproteobacteria bacterium]|jgi:exonuclease SbcD|nr:exonuclease SbcCD subunit D C-terminal domain-containing protein [Deltaproteobacteria bacterium]